MRNATTIAIALALTIFVGAAAFAMGGHMGGQNWGGQNWANHMGGQNWGGHMMAPGQHMAAGWGMNPGEHMWYGQGYGRQGDLRPDYNPSRQPLTQDADPDQLNR